MLGAVPPPPHRFPLFREGRGRGRGLGPAHFIIISKRLGKSIANHHKLVFLLRSSFKEYSLLGHVPGFKDVWHGKAHLFKGVDFLESSCIAFSDRYTSCLCFFSKKEPLMNFKDEGKLRIETPNKKPFNGRLWTNVLLAINVLVYVAQIASQGKLILLGAKINSFIDKGEFWRLATSSFLHANVGHLMVNCYSLNSVGSTMENISGPRRFLAIYFTSAIASSAMSYWFCKAPAVGASGAIFGLVGSYAVFILRHRNLFGGAEQDLQHIASVISLNMVIGILSKGIDNWGHLGGLLGGVATSWLVGPAWRRESSSSDGISVFADTPPIFYLNNKNPFP